MAFMADCDRTGVLRINLTLWRGRFVSIHTSDDSLQVMSTMLRRCLS